MRTDTITAPTAWACYLVNGDASGITDTEAAAADAYFTGWRVLGIEDDTERFTWSYQLYGGDASGGDVCDYIVTE